MESNPPIPEGVFIASQIDPRTGDLLLSGVMPHNSEGYRTAAQKHRFDAGAVYFGYSPENQECQSIEQQGAAALINLLSQILEIDAKASKGQLFKSLGNTGRNLSLFRLQRSL